MYVIFRDSTGAVWFGTSCFGACRYDGETFTWISDDEMTELDDGPSFGVRGIVEDRDGKFWLSNTLYRYDVPSTRSTDRKPGAPTFRKKTGVGVPEGKQDSGYSYFMSGVKDDQGDLWFATYGAGVWRYDGKNMTRYAVTDGGKPMTIFSIYKDRQGVLWLGTHAAGAYRFNGKAFERFGP